MEKIESENLLHRAFSVFLFNSKYELLLQVCISLYFADLISMWFLSCFNLIVFIPETLSISFFDTKLLKKRKTTSNKKENPPGN